ADKEEFQAIQTMESVIMESIRTNCRFERVEEYFEYWLYGVDKMTDDSPADSTSDTDAVFAERLIHFMRLYDDLLKSRIMAGPDEVVYGGTRQMAPNASLRLKLLNRIIPALFSLRPDRPILISYWLHIVTSVLRVLNREFCEIVRRNGTYATADMAFVLLENLGREASPAGGWIWTKRELTDLETELSLYFSLYLTRKVGGCGRRRAAFGAVALAAGGLSEELLNALAEEAKRLQNCEL
ncbi:MAG: hypothetical protein NTZ38_03135, partial [Candidatus Taylorbacteria bacterium]|nr:hypothetical protein [Candidatus Taylorbacteria bacterium]